MTPPSRRALATLLVGCWAVLLMAAGAGVARAASDPVSTAISELRNSSLYVDPSAPAAPLIDTAQVRTRSPVPA